MFQRLSRFFFEVRSELRKCSWPWDPKEKGFKRFKELTDSTLVVTVTMLLLGGFVSLVDLILSNAVRLLLELA